MPSDSERFELTKFIVEILETISNEFTRSHQIPSSPGFQGGLQAFRVVLGGVWVHLGAVNSVRYRAFPHRNCLSGQDSVTMILRGTWSGKTPKPNSFRTDRTSSL